MTSKTFVTIFTLVAILLTGCATSRIDWQHSKVVSILPNNLQGSTVAIYPLDKRKSNQIETEAIRRHLAQELSKLGINQVDPRQQIPTYFVLFDYARELGISANYEHALLIIAYASTNPPKQVYKAKLSIDSAKNDTVQNVNAAITSLLSSPR